MKVKTCFSLVFSLILITLSIGCVEEESGTKELGLSNIVFCAEEPTDYMTYVEQPDATYLPGEEVWIYFNLDNVKYNPNPDESNEIWFTEYLTVTDPDGVDYISQEIVNEHRNFPKEDDVENLWLRNVIYTTADMPTGPYTVQFDITDKLADKTVTVSTTFRLSA
jgi:hypothetical protein